MQDIERICGGCEFKATRTDAEWLLPQLTKMIADENYSLVNQRIVQKKNLFAPASQQELPAEEKKPGLLETEYIKASDVLAGIYEAFRLSKLQSIEKASLVYPDSLTKYEWLVLGAYTTGKNKAENEDSERRRKEKK